MAKPYLIGITGGSASGKTLILRNIRERFSSDEVCIISMDDYYQKKEFQPLDEKGISNFDTPESINKAWFTADLKKLLAGEGIQKETYTFNNPLLEPEILSIKPAPVIIAEGIFILYFREILELLDLKIFVDAKDYIRLKRRILRDQEERGYDLEDVLYRYENHVAPTFEKFIEPVKNDADLIIPNNSGFTKALELLELFIRNKIHD